MDYMISREEWTEEWTDNIPEEFETWLQACPVRWHKTGQRLIAPYEYDYITYTFSFDVPEEDSEQEKNNG
tara:strand:+ start:1935 stop:2144 length:210 start_codon:yes stop_codon:yes gene_type:complete